MKLIRGIKLGDYKLSNFKTTYNGPVMVVTFKVNAPDEVMAGKKLPPGPMSGWLSGLRSMLAGNSLPMPT